MSLELGIHGFAQEGRAEDDQLQVTAGESASHISDAVTPPLLPLGEGAAVSLPEPIEGKCDRVIPIPTVG